MSPAAGGAVGRRAFGLFAALAAANLCAWAWAFAAFGGDAALLGTALLAYGLGLRHAVDADHIAAIDNVTRKLMQDGKRPLAVGFWFAAGHSSLVIVAATALAAGTASLQQRHPGLLAAGSAIGTAASAAFLLAIAALNTAVLADVYRLVRRVRRGGDYRADELDGFLARRGLIGRVLRRLFGLISHSSQMYPLGIVFGLGFDTASEIGLLGIAASQAAGGLPVWSVLAFPLLFAAGMSLVDSADGVLMLAAYGWAFATPLRKLYYNLAITGLSVVVAAAIGGIEALGLAAGRLGLVAGPWAAARDDFGMLGYLIVAVFAAGWLGSVLLYRLSGRARADPA